MHEVASIDETSLFFQVFDDIVVGFLDLSADCS